MMAFKEKINHEMVLAAKTKDKTRLSALRMLKSGLHNREIDAKRELGEGEFLQLLSSMVKQRRDSIEQFAKGGRTDLVEKEEAELKVIEEFLPAQLSEAELDASIAEAIREAGAAGVRDMGKVMKILMPRLTGRADGKTVGDKVKARLSA
jgi:uncharacterized protein YqeY